MTPHAKKRYMTQKRKWQLFKIKAIALIAIVSIASSAIGYSSVKTEKQIEKSIPEFTVIKTVKAQVKEVKEEKKEKPLSVEEQIRAIAKEKNFKWPDYLVKLSKCESSLNPKAINVNRNGSRDLGLFQINDVHKLSDEFRFDIRKSTEWTINKINEGKQHIWVCNSKVLAQK